MSFNPQNYKIIFMGTPDFAVPVLESLVASPYFLVAVFTQPDKKVGREQKVVSSPIKKLALKSNIFVCQPEKLDQEAEQKISSLKPDLIVVAAYGQIIPRSILDIPKYSCVNVHASLLPEYRGASPIQSAILAGEKETGITIMLMDEKMDHGPILAQKKIKIYNNETGEFLHDRLAKVGAEFLAEVLPKYLEGKIKSKPQDHNKATFTKILTREDGHIDWTKSAEEIKCQVRAYYPWPGSWTVLDSKRLKIIQTSILNSQLSVIKKPGKVFLTENKELAIACGKGYLTIEKLQLEGKKEMTAEEFLRGYSNIAGTILK